MNGDRAGLRPETVAVVAGRPEHVPDAPLNPPLTLASTYVAGGALEYGRYGNPTWQAFEEAVGALEGGRGLAYPSGLAAWGAALELVRPDATVVAPRHAYLGSLGRLAQDSERHGITPRLVDVADTDAVCAAVVGAHLVLLESPTNPALEVADLPVLCAAARAAGALVVVDNTFATPVRPASTRGRGGRGAALGDEVPRRPQRRDARCAGVRRRRTLGHASSNGGAPAG